MEPGINFLEAEHLVKKFWDPKTKTLKIPNPVRSVHINLFNSSGKWITYFKKKLEFFDKTVSTPYLLYQLKKSKLWKGLFSLDSK